MAGTSADKLSYLNTTKNEIAEAIREKGVAVESDTTFRSYVDLIKQCGAGTYIGQSEASGGLISFNFPSSLTPNLIIAVGPTAIFFVSKGPSVSTVMPASNLWYSWAYSSSIGAPSAGLFSISTSGNSHTVQWTICPDASLTDATYDLYCI